jgi:hypothetical protein
MTINQNLESALDVVHKFLSDHNLKRSAEMVKRESKSIANYTIQKERYQNLIRTVGKVIKPDERLADESKPPAKKPTEAPRKKRATIKPMSGYEVENIMENFMNKLFMSPNLLEDEKLNFKIEKIFENKLFQKVVEEANVLEDAGDLSMDSAKRRRRQNQEDSHIADNNNILGNILDEKSEELIPYLQSPLKSSQPSESKQTHPTIKGMKRTESVGMLLGNHASLEGKKYDGMLPRGPIGNINLNNESENILIDGGDEVGDLGPSQSGDFMEVDEVLLGGNYGKRSEGWEGAGRGGSGVGVGGKKDEKMEKFLREDIEKISDIGSQKANDDSQFLQQSTSFFTLIEDNKDVDDQYDNDDDPGFELFEVEEQDFDKVCRHLAAEYDYPNKVVKKSTRDKKTPKDGQSKRDYNGKDGSGSKNGSNSETNYYDDEKDLPKEKGYIYLPPHLKHPNTGDEFYPKEFERTIYDCFSLKIIYDRERTGFEETKDFPIVIGSIVAGRYQVQEYLGSAAFSKAIQCVDLTNRKHYCMKIIENNKDYFDQSIDEIKLLKYITCNGNVDDKNVLKIYDYFYHKEHLFIVTEL